MKRSLNSPRKEKETMMPRPESSVFPTIFSGIIGDKHGATEGNFLAQKVVRHVPGSCMKSWKSQNRSSCEGWDAINVDSVTLKVNPAMKAIGILSDGQYQFVNGTLTPERTHSLKTKYLESQQSITCQLLDTVAIPGVIEKYIMLHMKSSRMVYNMPLTISGRCIFGKNGTIYLRIVSIFQSLKYDPIC